MDTRPLDSHGPCGAPSPVVISVPHAGRERPPGMDAMLAVSPWQLVALEDRCADLLIGDAVACGATAIVARQARAWIDLNRAPDEIDPATLVGGWSPPEQALPRIRAGLGLVPRLAGRLPIWSRRLTPAELDARLKESYFPFHEAIAGALTAARQMHDHVVLIDCHSMPPLPSGASIVIGDRHGTTASPQIVTRLEAIIRSHGFSVIRNTPYAGGSLIARHAAPNAGVHAIQLEIDRALYLNKDLRTPDRTGVARIRALIAELALCLDGSHEGILPLAAE